jgi:hypothetical protein
LLAVAATAVTAGCGSSGSTPRATTRSAPGVGQNGGPIPTPPPTGIPANPAAVSVIKAWSDALRRGDIAGAARYFAVPSFMINGPNANGEAMVIQIRSQAQAEAANVTLPCGAKFISADQRGRYTNALFRLTDRPGPGGGCGAGTGQTARTNFVIRARRIVEWIRAPDDPGDNAAPIQPSPGSPSGGTATGPAV